MHFNSISIKAILEFFVLWWTCLMNQGLLTADITMDVSVGCGTPSISKRIHVYSTCELRRIGNVGPFHTATSLCFLTLPTHMYGKKTQRTKRGGRRKQRQIKVVTNVFNPRPNDVLLKAVAHNKRTREIKCLKNLSLATRAENVRTVKIAEINAHSCRNKTVEIRHLIEDHEIDLLIIVETWLFEKGDEALITELTPSGYETESFPRHEQRNGNQNTSDARNNMPEEKKKKGANETRGGGIAIVYKTSLCPKFNKSQSNNFKSFEKAELLIDNKNETFRLHAIYRPPPSEENKLKPSDFIEEFEEFLFSHDILSKRNIIAGDFNFQFDQDSANIRKIKNLISDHFMYQHVDKPTQISGHVLDWVITSGDIELMGPVQVDDVCLADHSLVSFGVRLSHPAKPLDKKTITSRDIKKLDIETFKDDLSRCLESECNDHDLSVEQLDSAIEKTLNNHAPITTRTVNVRKPSPWYTEDVKKAKQQKRKAEKKWKKSGTITDKSTYIFHKKHLNTVTKNAKKDFYLKKFDNVKNTREFFQVSNNLLGKDKLSNLPAHSDAKELCEEFSQFFVDKIAKIRCKLDEGSCDDQQFPENSSFGGEPMTYFDEVSEEDLRKIILSSPGKSCQLDSIPTSLLKECIVILLPYLLRLTNDSLRTGIVPKPFKSAVVKPLLKKRGLDQDNMKNYRPVSNLTFLSKIMEKVVLKQIANHIQKNALQEMFQSAYRVHHSTETALLKIVNDLQQVIDSGRTTILTLLDLSAAFDTLDHAILLERLDVTFGLRDVVKRWIASYLENRSQVISIGDYESSPRKLLFGVPQGSVLGPLLFVLYTAPLSKIFHDHGLAYHMYADDSQIYSMCFNSDMEEKARTLENCIQQVGTWMTRNKLKLNADKTEAMFIGSEAFKDRNSHLMLTIDEADVPLVYKAKNLGVVLDNDLKMDSFIREISKAVVVSLKNIQAIRQYISTDTCKKIVVALVLSRIDYCNSLLSGLPQCHIYRLQKLQNFAARIVLQKRKSDDAYPLLEQLHWLPVEYRIQYKVGMLVYKSLNNAAPQYVSDMLQPYKPGRLLRSTSDALRLSIPRCRLKAGERSFQCFAPYLWNIFPKELRNSESVDIFRKRLKTYLFQHAFL